MNKVCLISSCAPFIGEKKKIQEASFYSWSLLPFEQVIILGNEQGVVDECDKYGFTNIQDVQYSNKTLSIDHSAIMLDDAFNKVVDILHDDIDIVVWMNSDIVVVSPDLQVFADIQEKYKSCAGWGRRWDLEMPKSFLISKNSKKELEIIYQHISDVVIHPYCGIDIFFWSKDLFIEQANITPNFVVNGWCTDHYFNYIQKTLTLHRFETTNAFIGIHLKHKTDTQFDEGWNRAKEHNQRLYTKYVSGKVPLPTMWR